MTEEKSGLLRRFARRNAISPHVKHEAGDDEHCRHRQRLRKRIRGSPLGGFLHAYSP